MALKKFTLAEVLAAENEVKAALGDHFLRSDQVGSSYIVGEGADLDIVVLVKDRSWARTLLLDVGYRSTSNDEYGDDEFETFRLDDVNIMLTQDKEWYDLFLVSSEVCRTLGLKSKWQRVAVHRVIMNDEDADTAREYAQDKHGVMGWEA